MHDMVRQPLLQSALWLLLVVIAAFGWGRPVAYETAAAITPLGGPLGAFQGTFPAISRVLAGFLISLVALRAGRITLRYNLFPVRTNLTIPLYAVFAVGILIGQAYLSESVAACLLLFSTQALCGSYRNGYAMGSLFRGSLFLGMLPLVYAPTLPLPLMLVVAIFCFRRTLREAFVAVCGVLLPTLTACYVAWWQGEAFTQVPVDMWRAMWQPSGYLILEHTTILSPALFGASLFVLLCALFFCAGSARTLSHKGRAVTLYTVLLLLFTCTLTALPSATPGLLGLIALPAAIIAPQTFVRIQPTPATILFLLFCGMGIVNSVL